MKIKSTTIAHALTYVRPQTRFLAYQHRGLFGQDSQAAVILLFRKGSIKRVAKKIKMSATVFSGLFVRF